MLYVTYYVLYIRYRYMYICIYIYRERERDMSHGPNSVALEWIRGAMELVNSQGQVLQWSYGCPETYLVPYLYLSTIAPCLSSSTPILQWSVYTVVLRFQH